MAQPFIGIGTAHLHFLCILGGGYGIYRRCTMHFAMQITIDSSDEPIVVIILRFEWSPINGKIISFQI